MNEGGSFRNVKTEEEAPPQHTTNSNNQTVAISLAELLAHFSVHRPLYTHESGALCYQLLGQLRDNLLPLDCSTSVWLTPLKYPTLANILLTETGLAFVNPVTSGTHTIRDWLTALAYTLRNHTLVTNTHESDTFRTLIESLGGGYSSSDQLLKRVQIWQTTCLFLCSLDTPLNAEHHDTEGLLETLHQRSNQAHNYRLCSGEMRQKLLPLTRNQPIPIPGSLGQYDTDNRPICTKQYQKQPQSRQQQHKQQQQTLIDSDHGPTDREAFNHWVERWKYVNAEYLARQLVLRGPTDRVDDAFSKINTTLPSVCINLSPPQSYQQIPVSLNEPLPKPCTVELQNMHVTTKIRKESFPQSGTNPSDGNSLISLSSTYMRTLKSMYTNLISRPLSLMLRSGLKDVQEQFCTETMQQSSIISNTLNGLNRLLRAPSMRVERQVNLENGDCDVNSKCNV